MFSEGEREHIGSVLRQQRAYDSADAVSKGKPVNGGLDLARAPVIASVVGKMTDLVGVRPDCIHLTAREGLQFHTSHSDKMGFDLRGTVHLGADVLLRGQADPAKSTGDFVLSGGGLSQPLLLRMRSGDAYIATRSVLHAPYRHGISAADQASLSVICTWSPGSGVFTLFRTKSPPLAATFSSLSGVTAVDGEKAFEFASADAVPPRSVATRIQQPGNFNKSSSLFPAPPEHQASAYHWLGTTHGATGGMV